jgi:hypothetical protein
VDRHRLLDPLNGPNAQNFASNGVVGPGAIEHDQSDVAQQQSGRVQITNRP